MNFRKQQAKSQQQSSKQACKAVLLPELHCALDLDGRAHFVCGVANLTKGGAA